MDMLTNILYRQKREWDQFEFISFWKEKNWFDDEKIRRIILLVLTKTIFNKNKKNCMGKCT